MLLGRRFLVASLALFTAACATNTTPGKHNNNSFNPFPGFDYKTELVVSAGVPADYSLSITFDHATLVTDGKAAADGSDVRIFYVEGSNVTELDRVVEPNPGWGTSKTTVWFQTVGTGGDGRYWLTYGNSAPDPVKQDPSAVFAFFDDFNDVTLGSSWLPGLVIGNATGSVIPLGDRLRISCTGDGLGDTRDDFYGVFRPVQGIGDFVATASIGAIGGDLGDEARTGIMVRQSTGEVSKHATTGLRNLPRAVLSRSRTDDGSSSAETEGLVPDVFPQVVQIKRHDNLFDSGYLVNGEFVGLGNTALMNGAMEPLLVGFPMGNASSTGDGWVEVEWIRIRKFVDPEPTVTLGDEEGN